MKKLMTVTMGIVVFAMVVLWPMVVGACENEVDGFTLGPAWQFPANGADCKEQTDAKWYNEILEETEPGGGFIKAGAKILPKKDSEPGIEKIALFDMFAMMESTGTIHTGLIVDARNTGLRRSMSPTIMFPDGSRLWGAEDADIDFVISAGVASYHNNMGEAFRDQRVGDNPLYVKATGTIGAGRSSAVLSEQNGRIVLEADAEGDFLRNYAVVFLID